MARRDRPALTLDADGHRALARQLNAAVWDGLASDRDPARDAELVDLAHASLHHWRAAAGTAELVRGEWLVSRVYAVNHRPEPARYHAHRAYELCVAQQLGGFDLAYAYEGMARALAVGGDDYAEWHARAVAAGESIEDPEDAAIFAADLDAPPWS
ncbi:MAG TPA: hypothetical protein VNA20_01070 [Frankiaceae bacterium]|nr:hypothetical protein [Frankiaceae bacterium]